jgi:hypothetical protein
MHNILLYCGIILTAVERTVEIFGWNKLLENELNQTQKLTRE